MAIDWLTVSAQIINFLILVFLLKRFLYRPILDAMKRRQQRIDDEIATAEQNNVQAQALCQQYEAQLAELENHRAKLLEQAQQEVESERLALLGGIRTEIEKQRSQWQISLEHEQRSEEEALKKAIIQQVDAVSRRVLKDLADSELELEMMHQLIQRFAMHTAEKDKFLDTVSSNGDKLTISSTQHISEKSREKMTATLHHFLNQEIQIDFEIRSDMICGIALEAGGRRWEWSIDSYLSDLDTAVSNLVIPTARQTHHV